MAGNIPVYSTVTFSDYLDSKETRIPQDGDNFVLSTPDGLQKVDTVSLYNNIKNTLDIPKTLNSIKDSNVTNATLQGDLSQNIAASSYSFAQGYNTQAKNMAAHSEGMLTTAAGYISHAEGHYSRTSAAAAHAEGDSTLASGEGSHAQGHETIASGDFSHAQGQDTQAAAAYSHAQGQHTFADGQNSHAQGQYTQARGQNSHAQGQHTEANAYNSHAQGKYTIAASMDQMAIGHFNIADSHSKYAFIIGNGDGTDLARRSNAFAVDWEGNAEISKAIKTPSLILNGTQLARVGGDNKNDGLVNGIATSYSKPRFFAIGVGDNSAGWHDGEIDASTSLLATTEHAGLMSAVQATKTANLRVNQLYMGQNTSEAIIIAQNDCFRLVHVYNQNPQQGELYSVFMNNQSGLSHIIKIGGTADPNVSFTMTSTSDHKIKITKTGDHALYFYFIGCRGVLDADFQSASGDKVWY